VKLPVLDPGRRARLTGNWVFSRSAGNAHRLRELLSMKSVLLHNNRSFGKPQKTASF
jgi:hypothetical protein